MRFIHKWSFICARYLTKQINENHEKRRVFYYGFQVIIGALVKIILLVGISLLFGSLLPSLVAVTVFGSFRMFGGGYHMNTYGKCIAISLGLFILIGILAQYTYKYWINSELIILVIVTLITALFVTFKWVPKDTPNNPITEVKKIQKFKRLSIIYILLWASVMWVLIYFNVAKHELLVISAGFGFLLELFTISPIGYSFFDKINGKVDLITLKKSA